MSFDVPITANLLIDLIRQASSSVRVPDNGYIEYVDADDLIKAIKNHRERCYIDQTFGWMVGKTLAEVWKQHDPEVFTVITTWQKTYGQYNPVWANFMCTVVNPELKNTYSSIYKYVDSFNDHKIVMVSLQKDSDIIRKVDKYDINPEYGWSY